MCRFRERQRQRVAELEEKVAELEARLANVKVEKASLANRNGMLEKVVAMGDHKVQRMRSIVKVWWWWWWFHRILDSSAL